MAEERKRAFQRHQPHAVINLVTLEPGNRVRLRGEAIGEVVSNPRDGSWVFVRYLAFPADPSLVGSEELVFADDIVEVL